MRQIMIVAIGGGIGAVFRYGLGELVHRFSGPLFPWGTLVVNLVGCFLIGISWEVSNTALVPPQLRLFIMTGLLGAFTTFSTFSLETLALIQDGEFRLAVTNQVASVGLGLLLVLLGVALVRALSAWQA